MKRSELATVLAKHAKIAVAGGPRTGKTTLVRHVFDRPVFSTDDTMSQPWEDQPQIAIERVQDREKFVLEGVQVGRALRKGLKVDAVIVMEQPMVELSPHQASMAAGCRKILAEALEMNPDLVVYRVEPD